jgi:hypothetical protein
MKVIQDHSGVKGKRICPPCVCPATAEWIVTTYAQRNWVEVFYREAKGWLGYLNIRLEIIEA